MDLLIITETAPSDSWLEDLRNSARKIWKAQMPEASGIDIISMSEPEFKDRARLRNNMANTIVKEGCPIMPGENLDYRTSYEDEETDWDEVDQKTNDADGAASWINTLRDAGLLDGGDDKQFGRIAQTAPEFACKAAIATHGHEYPSSGRDGHNLTILTQLMRSHEIIGGNGQAPGEQHRYLSEFGGAAVCAHEHPPLDRHGIARHVPAAVARLKEITNSARP